MFWKQVLVQILVALFTARPHESKKIPSYIELCHRDDPNMSTCLKTAIESVRPYMKIGVPELQIPPMDPYLFRQVGVDGGAFKASLNNIQLYHADKVNIRHFNIDLRNNHMSLSVRFPMLRIKCIYNIEGEISVVKLGRPYEGSADGNLTVDIKIESNATRYIKRTKEYIKFGKPELDLKVESPKFQIDSIFKDDHDLNDEINKIINKKIIDIMQSLKPLVADTMLALIWGIIERVFRRFSLGELFLV